MASTDDEDLLDEDEVKPSYDISLVSFTGPLFGFGC
jgi:hypothetical protein